VTNPSWITVTDTQFYSQKTSLCSEEEHFRRFRRTQIYRMRLQCSFRCLAGTYIPVRFFQYSNLSTFRRNLGSSDVSPITNCVIKQRTVLCINRKSSKPYTSCSVLCSVCRKWFAEIKNWQWDTTARVSCPNLRDKSAERSCLHI
jgi:hypothetical protein